MITYFELILYIFSVKIRVIRGLIIPADFYKVYAYTCLYASFEKVPITNMTITFVENHYPRKLIAHFRETRNYTVEKKSSGIYTIRKMRNNELTIEQVFEEVGWIAKWKAEGEVKGEERKAVNIAKNMVKLGYPLEAVVSATELEPEKVKELYPG